MEDRVSNFLNLGVQVGGYVLERLRVSVRMVTPLEDVSDDYSKGRIYLPLEDLRQYGVTEEDISGARNTPPFCELMRFEVERAHQWFQQGLPLVKQVDRELAVDLELFSRGGQEILNAIERQGYAVLGRRPAISKTRKLALVARAALGKLQWGLRGNRV